MKKKKEGEIGLRDHRIDATSEPEPQSYPLAPRQDQNCRWSSEDALRRPEWSDPYNDRRDGQNWKRQPTVPIMLLMFRLMIPRNLMLRELFPPESQR